MLGDEELEKAFQLVGVAAHRGRHRRRVDVLCGSSVRTSSWSRSRNRSTRPSTRTASPSAKRSVEQLDVVPDARLDAAARIDELEREVRRAVPRAQSLLLRDRIDAVDRAVLLELRDRRHDRTTITDRIPSCASISSKPRLTSSSVRRCEMSGATSISPPSQRSTSCGHLVASLDAAERRARDPAAGDQKARHDVERLALAGDAAHRREPPAHARRLDRLPHDADVAGRLERVVGAEAAGQLEDLLHGVGAADRASSVAPWPRASSSRSAERSTATIRSAPCSRQPATAPSPTSPAPKTTQVEPGSHLRGVHRRAEPGREPAREDARVVERRLRRDLRERDLRHHRVLGERRGAHEVPDRLAVAGEPRRPVREIALVLLLADREAEVRPGVAAVRCTRGTAARRA